MYLSPTLLCILSIVIGYDISRKESIVAVNQKVKDMAIQFLYVDIKPNKYIDVFCDHPYTDSWFVFDGKDMMDLHNQKNADKWRENIRVLLEKCDSLVSIMLLMSKKYFLTFLDYTESFMSNEELGEILSIVWAELENINTNGVMSKQKLLNLFLKADKKSLMDLDALNIYNTLDDKITVYRGINIESTNKETNVKNLSKYWKALSWTTNIETAEWFARRWIERTDKEITLIVFETVVDKKDVIATFNYENEVVVNFKKIKPDDIKVHILSN